jgi:hypothetical protein
LTTVLTFSQYLPIVNSPPALKAQNDMHFCAEVNRR